MLLRWPKGLIYCDVWSFDMTVQPHTIQVRKLLLLLLLLSSSSSSLPSPS